MPGGLTELIFTNYCFINKKSENLSRYNLQVMHQYHSECSNGLMNALIIKESSLLHLSPIKLDFIDIWICIKVVTGYPMQFFFVITYLGCRIADCTKF